jgi:geranylgeranyl diphosphate synthase type II
VAEEFTTMARHTVSGQATELGWRRDGVVDLTPEDYLDLIMRKTCWYTTVHPLRVGALIGAWGRADLDALVRFGAYLGAAFQIQDDLLNLVGDESAYGKEIDGDLYEGKRTLVLIHLVQHAEGSDRDTVHHYLGLEREARPPELVAEIRSMMDAYGSIDFTQAYAQGIASAAHDALDEAFGGVEASEATVLLRSLIPFMLDRRS